jgi:hypothetical protein
MSDPNQAPSSYKTILMSHENQHINYGSSTNFHPIFQDYKEFSLSKLEHYEKIKFIAADAFEEIYFYKRKHDGLQVYLKFINLRKIGISNYSDFETELKILM